jgi:YVTN family beta-propeller protein
VYASSDGTSSVSVIDTRTDQVTASIDVGQTPHGLAITPDGSRVLVGGFRTDQIEAIDTRTNQLMWEVPLGQPHSIAITPDGTTAYVGSQQKGAEALATRRCLIPATGFTSGAEGTEGPTANAYPAQRRPGLRLCRSMAGRQTRPRAQRGDRDDCAQCAHGNHPYPHASHLAA